MCIEQRSKGTRYLQCHGGAQEMEGAYPCEMLQLPTRPPRKCSSYNYTLHADSHNLVRCWNWKLYFSFGCSWCCTVVLHKWSLMGYNCYCWTESCVQQNNIFQQNHRHTNHRPSLFKQYITTVFYSLPQILSLNLFPLWRVLKCFWEKVCCCN